MRCLVTGYNGFLMSYLIPCLKYDIVYYEVDKEYKDIDIVIHFASPSDDFDFLDKSKTAHSMIDMTIELLNIARKNNAKFIFSSSMASQEITNEYSVYKLAMEHYIQSTYNNHCILRIPRVYGQLKKKGLMRKFREDLVPPSDMNLSIEYIDIHEWLLQTIQYIKGPLGLFEYNNLTIDTLYNIKHEYINTRRDRIYRNTSS